MKWMIGVDLRDACEGALAWARWVRKRDRSAQIAAAHAVEVPKGLVLPNLDTVNEHVTRFVERRLSDVDIRVLDEHPPEAALGHAIGVHGADALVIGRQAARDGDAIVRLGGVARRLLRTLPAPVLVCPPDLRPENISEGPVLACVQPNVEGAAALAFARDVATSADLPLHAVTVLPPAFPQGISYLPASSYTGESHEQREAEVRAWLGEQPGEAVELMTGDGPVVPTILRAASELDASMVVCGSRLLSTLARILNTSVGTALAASARIPVAVVPPTP